MHQGAGAGTSKPRRYTQPRKAVSFPLSPHLLPLCAVSPWLSRETLVPFKTRQAREAWGAWRAVTAHVLRE